MKLTALALIAALSLLGGCREEPKAKPLDVPGQKLYKVTGKILSRDAGDNTIRTDHDAIPGFMEAMTMDYSVRGADVGTLPPDGSRFQATLHVTADGYWLTGVQKAP